MMSCSATLPLTNARCSRCSPQGRASRNRSVLAHVAAQPSAEPLRVAVVGGGLAGLAAAVALTTRGFIVTVFERERNETAQAFTGIQLWPWGLSALGRIESSSKLRQTVLASGDVIDQLLLRKPSGETLLTHRVAEHERSACIAYDSLLAELAAQLPPNALRFDHSLVNWEERESSEDSPLTVFFTGRDTGERTSYQADVVVGADGMLSRVRSLLRGGKAPHMVSGGSTVWRGIVDASRVPPDLCPAASTVCTHSDDGRTLVVTSIGTGRATLSGGRLFWMLSMPTAPGAQLDAPHPGGVNPLRDWRQPASPDERVAAELRAGKSLTEATAAGAAVHAKLLKTFGDFRDALSLVRATPEGDIVERCLYSRAGRAYRGDDDDGDLAMFESAGRATLLGDAGISHLPVLGLGANLGLQAAADLGDALAGLTRGSSSAEVRAALRGFEEKQRRRAAEMEMAADKQTDMVVLSPHTMLPISADAFAGWMLGNAKRAKWEGVARK